MPRPSYAKLMEGEHHALWVQTDATAKKLNIALQLPTDEPPPAAAAHEA